MKKTLKTLSELDIDTDTADQAPACPVVTQDGVVGINVFIPLQFPRRSGGPTRQMPTRPYGKTILFGGRSGEIGTPYGTLRVSANIYGAMDRAETAEVIESVLSAHPDLPRKADKTGDEDAKLATAKSVLATLGKYKQAA